MTHHDPGGHRPSRSADDLIGEVIDGKYQVLSRLGRGGMGTVFHAVHLGTDRAVALKIIAPALAGDPEYLERFRREARACGRLRHPGIVDVTDFGVATHRGRPLPYLVMEFLDGCTLAEALREVPVPPLPWVIDVLEQVCAAVDVAHRQNILHRDLKPENVWLEPRRHGVHVKVLDFGLAKLDSAEWADTHASRNDAVPEPLVNDLDASEAATVVTRASPAIVTAAAGATTTGVAGTPAFMSPEQSRGEPASTRSDVYSIGVMAYHMIAGRLPFEGTADELMAAHAAAEAPPLTEIRPEVHDDAARLVAVALSKDPAKRPASAVEFGNMLAAQLEPAGALFTRALVLFVSHLRSFLTIGALACAPLLAASMAAAGWQAMSLVAPLPAPAGPQAWLAIGLLLVLAMQAQVAIGAMPLFVLHALSAPDTFDPVALMRNEYGPRLRAWLRDVLPLVAGALGVILAALIVVAVLVIAAPAMREWPRWIRLPVRLLAVAAPFAIGLIAFHRAGGRQRQMSLIGSVMLVERLPFRAAAGRATLLMHEAGGLRNAVQRSYILGVSVVGLAIGLLAGSNIGIRQPGVLLTIAPLGSLALMVLLTLQGIISTLIYLSARRSRGESLEDIYRGAF